MLRIVDQNRSAAAFVLLVVLCGVLTLTMQSSVGGMSIYSESYEVRRLQAHDSILNNQLPVGAESWNSIGGNGTNIRIAAVYLAEAMHQVLGISVIHSYWFIDTVSLFLALFLLYFFLSNWLPRHYAALGVIYVGSVLPLTYLFVLFHPWDRLSLLSWVVLFMLVRSRRTLILGVVLALSVSIKYDVVLLPGLYWLAHVSRARFTRTTLETAALFVVSFGVYFGLRAMLPGGFGGGPGMAALMVENLQRFVQLAVYFPPVAYPPILVFLLPVLLIVSRFPKDDQFLRAGIVFAGALICYFFIASHFEEVRAHMPLLLLILPAALLSLQSLLEPVQNKSDG
jgi:hypothetical protein